MKTSLGIISMARQVLFILASHIPMPVVFPSMSLSPQIHNSLPLAADGRVWFLPRRRTVPICRDPSNVDTCHHLCKILRPYRHGRHPIRRHHRSRRSCRRLLHALRDEEDSNSCNTGRPHSAIHIYQEILPGVFHQIQGNLSVTFPGWDAQD